MYWHPARGRDTAERLGYRTAQMILLAAIAVSAIRIIDSQLNTGTTYHVAPVYHAFQFVSTAVRSPLGWVHVLIVTVLFHAWAWRWQWKRHLEQIALTRLKARECAFFGAMTGALPALHFAAAHAIIIATTFFHTSWWSGIPPLAKYGTYLLLVISAFAPFVQLFVTVFFWLRLADRYRWALLMISGLTTLAILTLWFAVDRYLLKFGWDTPFLGLAILFILARLVGHGANKRFFSILTRDDE